MPVTRHDRDTKVTTIAQAIAILDHNIRAAYDCGEDLIGDDLRAVRMQLAGVAIVHFDYEESILTEAWRDVECLLPTRAAAIAVALEHEARQPRGAAGT